MIAVDAMGGDHAPHEIVKGAVAAARDGIPILLCGDPDGINAIKKEFPDWDSFYKESDIEKMPWFFEKLDNDVLKEIKSKDLSEGKFLDLGTGPGTQGMQLTNLGFNVIGSDLSKNAMIC